MGYLPGAWHDFGVSVASLAGALTGLLFVAVSIKADRLAASRNLSSRAAQTLVLFMASAINCILLVAPQPATAFGAELLASSLVFGALLFVLGRRAGHDPVSRVARYMEKASPSSITVVLFGVAGITFLAKAGGGLYWLLPAVVASLGGGVINAWLFLIRIPAEDLARAGQPGS